jgi:uncharacterized protein involved in copper resistance
MMNKNEMAGNNLDHRESAKTRNFGMNHATNDRSSKKAVAAMTTPDAMESAR